MNNNLYTIFVCKIINYSDQIIFIIQMLNNLNKDITENPEKLQQLLKTNVLQPSEINYHFINCYRWRKEFVKFLPIFIKYGANINQIQSGQTKRTIFMSACASGNIQVVKQMIQYKPNFNIKDTRNRNALFYALQSKHESIRILQLIRQKQPELINKSEASNRKTLLIYAIQLMDHKAIGYLIDKDINVNVYLEDTFENPLHLLVKKYISKPSDKQILNLIQLLVQKNCNKTAKNKQGKTPLQLCQSQQIREQLQKIFNSVLKPKQEENIKSIENSKNFIGMQLIKNNNKIIKNRLPQNPQQENKIAINKENDSIVIIDSAVEKNIKSVETPQIIQKKEVKIEKEISTPTSNKISDKVNTTEDWFLQKNLINYLEEQIKLFTEEIQYENKQNKNQFDQLIKLIAEELDKTLNLEVKVYGSYATRLCLKESDIDVVVIPKTPSSMSPAYLLEKIDIILKELSFVKSTNFISTALMPVIKVSCSEKYKFKRIDITLQTIGHNGLNCVQIIQNYMSNYAQLQPLAFVLKTFIYHSNLHDTYQGGLSSYGLILMIVAFIQKQYLIKKPNQKLLIADLLVNFLEFYGFKFDYINKAIYVQKPFFKPQQYNGFIFTVSDPSYHPVDMNPRLVLLDPLNINNNVGRSTYQIKTVQNAFSVAYVTIHTNYNCGQLCKYKRISKSESNTSQPCCILKRMFNSAKCLLEL